MIEDWGMRHVVANGFGFSLTAFVTGAITDAIGQAFGNVPGFPGPLVYFLWNSISSGARGESHLSVRFGACNNPSKRPVRFEA
jgi:hypothetical protein